MRQAFHILTWNSLHDTMRKKQDAVLQYVTFMFKNKHKNVPSTNGIFLKRYIGIFTTFIHPQQNESISLPTLFITLSPNARTISGIYVALDKNLSTKPIYQWQQWLLPEGRTGCLLGKDEGRPTFCCIPLCIFKFCTMSICYLLKTDFFLKR